MFNSEIVCCYLYPITKYGYPPPAEYTETYIDEMFKLGFTSVELEGIREKHLLTIYQNRFDIKKKLDKLNVKIPYFCAVLPGVSSNDEKVRKHNYFLFEKGCQTAALFGSKGILDNAPLPPYIFPDDIPVIRHHDENSLREAYFPENFSWNKYWEELIETFRVLCDIAAEYKLTYQLHPAAGFLSSSTDGFLYLFDAVKRNNLRFNFDTANLFAMKENLPLSLLRLKDHIDYIHFSDNRGARVEHLAIGDGKIPWNKFFEMIDKIKFKGNIGIDIGGDESGVENLDSAYIKAAEFLEINWLKEKSSYK